MVIEKNIKKHSFLRGGPERWFFTYKTKDVRCLADHQITVKLMGCYPAVEVSPRESIVSRYSSTTINKNYYSTITL